MTFVKWLSRVGRALSDQSHGLYSTIDDFDTDHLSLNAMWEYGIAPETVADMLLKSKQKRPEEH